MRSTLWIVSAVVALFPGVAQAQEGRQEGQPGHERLRRAFEEAVQNLERQFQERAEAMKQEFARQREQLEADFRRRAEEWQAQQERPRGGEHDRPRPPQEGHDRPPQEEPNPHEILQHIARQLDGLFGQIRELREGMERAHHDMAPMLQQGREMAEHGVRELHERVRQLEEENGQLRLKLFQRDGFGEGPPHGMEGPHPGMEGPHPGMERPGRRGPQPEGPPPDVQRPDRRNPQGRNPGRRPQEEGVQLLEQARDRMQELGQRLQGLQNPEMRQRVQRQLQQLQGRWQNLRQRGPHGEGEPPRLMILRDEEGECEDCGRHECEHQGEECERECEEGEECEDCEEEGGECEDCEEGEDEDEEGDWDREGDEEDEDEDWEEDEDRRGRQPRRMIIEELREGMEGRRAPGRDQIRGRIQQLIENWRRDGFDPDQLRERIERLLEGLRQGGERPRRDRDQDRDRQIVVQAVAGDEVQSLRSASGERTARLVVRVADGRPQVHFAHNGRGCCGEGCPALRTSAAGRTEPPATTEDCPSGG